MTFDWQAIVVTLIALIAASVVVARFLPKRTRAANAVGSGRAASAAAACDHCASGAAATKAGAAPSSTVRTQTTPVVSVGDLRASAKRQRHD